MCHNTGARAVQRHRCLAVHGHWRSAAVRGAGQHGARALYVCVCPCCWPCAARPHPPAPTRPLAASVQAGSLAVLLAMLFGGFLLSRNKMPGLIGWASGLSYVRWAGVRCAHVHCCTLWRAVPCVRARARNKHSRPALRARVHDALGRRIKPKRQCCALLHDLVPAPVLASHALVTTQHSLPRQKWRHYGP